jgi:gliding motility-associated-like protein
MKTIYKHLLKPFLLLVLGLITYHTNAQVFWTEDFGTGCSSGQEANNFNPSINGNWTVNQTGFNDANANEWFVSAEEAGMGLGVCGDGCGNNASLSNRTLHIGANLVLFGLVDLGASYLAGFNSNTDKRVESPTINCTGRTNITLDFLYLSQGVPGSDFCEVYYINAGTPAFLALLNPTNNASCFPQGLWTNFSIALPPSADNNPNVKIAFRWVNTDQTGEDPSIAIDDITLSGTASAINSIATGNITPTSVCACAAITVPFTSIGTFNAGNIYTAELSNASGSFATPTNIGTLNSTANSGSINATIPCNTPAGTQYRIRVVSSNPAIQGTNNGVDLTVSSTPTVTVNSPTICAGQTATLTASGASSYTWSAGITPTGVSTATISPVSTTTFTLTGTSNGCSSTITGDIIVSSSLNISVNSPTICSGQVATLTANGGSTYTWSAGITPTGVNTATVSPASTITFTVTGDSGGCTGTTTGTVTVGSTLAITVNSPTICSGQVATLTANGGSTYTWSAGITPTGVNTATVSPASTITFTVTGNSSGCTGTAIGTVNIASALVITVNSPTLCSGQAATLTASGANTYTWSSGATPTGVNTATVSPLTTTNYTVTGNSAGCIGSAVATVSVTSCGAPVASFTATPTILCESGCVNFTDLSTNLPTAWLWLFPGSSTPNSVDQNPSGICYDTLGSYDVILVVSNANGFDSLALTGFIQVVSPIPVTISGNLITNGCESTVLTANPAGQSYAWGPNANMSCADCQSATVSPTSTQDYYVNYVDVNGCSAGDTTTVTVTSLFHHFMPTGITPNGDGVNDEAHVQGRGITSIDLRIFNREGTKIFETSDITKGWDGTYHGIALNNDVFTYSLIVAFCDGSVKKESGNITLIK